MSKILVGFIFVVIIAVVVLFITPLSIVISRASENTEDCDPKIYGVPQVEFQHNSGLVFQQVTLEWNVVSGTANNVDIFLKKPSTDDNLVYGDRISSGVIRGQIEIPVDESGGYTVTLFADNQGQCQVRGSKSFWVVF